MLTWRKRRATRPRSTNPPKPPRSSSSLRRRMEHPRSTPRGGAVRPQALSTLGTVYGVRSGIGGPDQGQTERGVPRSCYPTAMFASCRCPRCANQMLSRAQLSTFACEGLSGHRAGLREHGVWLAKEDLFLLARAIAKAKGKSLEELVVLSGPRGTDGRPSGGRRSPRGTPDKRPQQESPSTSQRPPTFVATSAVAACGGISAGDDERRLSRADGGEPHAAIAMALKPRARRPGTTASRTTSANSRLASRPSHRP